MTRREKMVEAISKYLCIRFGMEPIDSLDGGPNWWMFHNDVDAFIAGLEKRGFTVND
jgi:hypothetical protein